MPRHVVLIGSVVAANVLAGYLAVLAGTTIRQVCVDSFSSASGSGCFETGRHIDWGLTQVVVFALMVLSLSSLIAYLVRGSRRWLVVTLVVATGFVVVPAALMAPAVFNDSGRVQLPLFRRLSAEFFIIKSENMYPRLKINQRVEFDMGAYATQSPEVGDIVILHPPVGARKSRCGEEPRPRRPCANPYGGPDTSVRFVDRVVAVGGDRLSFRHGRVVRNGKLETRKNLRRCRGYDACELPRTITVPAGHVYVAGDNRGSSDDSRFWGAVPVAQVLGRYVRIAGTCGC